VALLALIAGAVSYLHVHMLIARHGQPDWVAALTPLSVATQLQQAGAAPGPFARVVVVSPVVVSGSRSRPRWLMALADRNAAETPGALDAWLG
jgi:hypothetical protein